MDQLTEKPESECTAQELRHRAWLTLTAANKLGNRTIYNMKNWIAATEEGRRLYALAKQRETGRPVLEDRG